VISWWLTCSGTPVSVGFTRLLAYFQPDVLMQKHQYCGTRKINLHLSLHGQPCTIVTKYMGPLRQRKMPEWAGELCPNGASLASI
jgi:hypothetical protein